MTVSGEPTPWHALATEAVLARVQAHPDGLSPEEACARLRGIGPNVLQSAPGPSVPALVLRQFQNPLIYMLLAAAVVSLLAGHRVDGVVILAVVVLNAVVGVLQEWRAEQALEALRRLTAPRARVLRAGKVETVPAAEVVPGDILVLESGDRVAADARMLESEELQVDESALTGESRPIAKATAPLPERLPLADRTNMVWMTTPVTHGRGQAVVTATGMETMMGEIAREVRRVRRAPTPLQQRMSRLGALMGGGAIILALVIFLLGLLRGNDVYTMLLTAVAVAVSAIPEGLPAVISVVLALGVQRMAARHAVIRRLPAVETLGSTTVICTDKTGTITGNAMTVTRLWTGGKIATVTGEGFSPEGTISTGTDPDVHALLILGVLANDAVLVHTEKGWTVDGDPTEGALLAVAHKGGMAPEEEQRRAPRLDEIPFSSSRQYMATLHRLPEGAGTAALVKGAPERVLAFCSYLLVNGIRRPLDAALRATVLEAYTTFAADGQRVLAGAYRLLPAAHNDIERADVEAGLIFAGMWGMIDPPRPEATAAIAAAQRAGIRILMITGDHAVTATAIARQVGLLTNDQATITGEELDELSDEMLRWRIGRLAVFARVAPAHKLRIVAALRAQDEIVAMTGDGVNDAPALKSADIGIAMGITGTEVAKEAADMVLIDDNFATIVNAIEEGRTIFGNLQKVTLFLLVTNLGEILTITATLLIGLPLPVSAVMILWINLATDGACTIPLGLEPRHGDVLRRPPRGKQAEIIDPSMLRRLALLAPLMAVGTVLLYWLALRGGDYPLARTTAFTTLTAFQWFQAMSARSRRSSLFTLGLGSNRWLLGSIGVAVLLQVLIVHWAPLQHLFGTVDLSLAAWGWILLVASSILLVDEAVKLIAGWRRGEKTFSRTSR